MIWLIASVESLWYIQARLERGCGTGKEAEGPGVDADSREPFLFPIAEPVDKL